jgi:hypothetical protein
MRMHRGTWVMASSSSNLMTMSIRHVISDCRPISWKSAQLFWSYYMAEWVVHFYICYVWLFYLFPFCSKTDETVLSIFITLDQINILLVEVCSPLYYSYCKQHYLLKKLYVHMELWTITDKYQAKFKQISFSMEDSRCHVWKTFIFCLYIWWQVFCFPIFPHFDSQNKVLKSNMVLTI